MELCKTIGDEVGTIGLSPGVETVARTDGPGAGFRSLDVLFAELAANRQRYEDLRSYPESMGERARLISLLHALRAEASLVRDQAQKEGSMHPYNADILVTTIMHDRLREAERYRREHPKISEPGEKERIGSRLRFKNRPRDTRPTSAGPRDNRPGNRPEQLCTTQPLGS